MNRNYRHNITVTKTTGQTTGILGATGGTESTMNIWCRVDNLSMAHVLRYGLDAEFSYYKITMNDADINKNDVITYNGKDLKIVAITEDLSGMFLTLICSYAK